MEIADIYDIALRRARKEHKCYCCLGKIKPGEHYHAHEVLFDGRWDRMKVCSDCEAMRNKMNKGKRDPDDMEWPETVQDAAFEYDGQYASKFVDTKLRRGAEVPEWMFRRVKKINKFLVDFSVVPTPKSMVLIINAMKS